MLGSRRQNLREHVMTRSKLIGAYKRLSLVVIVPLAVILTFTVGDWLRSVIINPVVYSIWIFKEFVAALPDLPIWLLFVFMAALAVSVTLIDLFKAPLKLPKQHPFMRRGRVGELADRVKQAEQGEFFRWRLTRQLGDLAIDLIAMKRRVDQRSARQIFEAGTWTQETRVKDFLRAEPQIRPHAALERVRRYFKPRRRGDKSCQTELEEVVSFLEAYARERL